MFLIVASLYKKFPIIWILKTSFQILPQLFWPLGFSLVGIQGSFICNWVP